MRLLLVATLLACTPKPPASRTLPPAITVENPDPPMRPVLELPRLDARAALDSEESIFETIQRLYARSGYPDVDEVTIALDPMVLVPSASDATINSPRFFVGPEGVRGHLGRVSTLLYGERIELAKHFASDAEAMDGYRAFMTALVAHEIAHSLAYLRGVQDLSVAWAEESRAIDFEWPIMNELARLGRIPPTWPSLYVQFNQALLAAAPAGLVATLPADEAGRVAVFRADYFDVLRHLGSKRHPNQDKVDRVLALYSQYRLERVARPPVSMASLVKRIPPDADRWAIAMAELAAESRPTMLVRYAQEAPGVLRVNAGALVAKVTYERAAGAAHVTLDPGQTVPAGKRVVVADLLVRIAHRTQNDALELGPDGGLVVRGMAILVGARPSYYGALRERIHDQLDLLERWQPAIAAVVAGKPVAATFDATVAAERADAEAAKQSGGAK